MEEKLVSIITPTYNCGKFIGETIKSVIDQTYKNWEMIIVDDCSGDNTGEVVEGFSDSRIKYILLEKNSGAAVARTRAMEEAEGTYMAFLDSDDLWHPEKLQKQIAFMEENGFAFTATDYNKMTESGEILKDCVKVPDKVNYNRLLLDCPVGNSTVMYDVSKLGKFKVPDIRKRNDDALWLQILKKEKYIRGLSETLMYYRLRENSISANKFTLVKYHWKLYREIEHLSVLRSAFHICVWVAIKVLKIK